MSHILIIDNYDSFTYNLVHYVEQCLNEDVLVIRNDQFNQEDIENASKVILSPGPGLPKEAGKMPWFIENYARTGLPILGVCLGHQALAEYFGASLKNLPQVHHGVEHTLTRTNIACPVLGNTSKQFKVGRYHSWVADQQGFPEELLITSTDCKGEIMSFRHKSLPVYAVQFHPESIMTRCGLAMVEGFLGVKSI